MITDWDFLFAQTRVGKLLAQQCAPSLKKLTLELGGNNPYIVFDDANLDHAAESKPLLAITYTDIGKC
jgi:acyl-CoA reductase-like NAD-dependent aldehyde dehydrogenase